ncbi:MAG: hypothetical protein ACKOEC_11815, partial [Acidimicrobiia bacterium]
GERDRQLPGAQFRSLQRQIDHLAGPDMRIAYRPPAGAIGRTAIRRPSGRPARPAGWRGYKPGSSTDWPWSAAPSSRFRI